MDDPLPYSDAIRWLLHRPAGWLVAAGWEWFHTTLRPAIDKAEKNQNTAPQIVGEAWHRSADLAQFVGAYQSQLELLQKSLTASPRDFRAVYEAAEYLLVFGNIELAEKAWKDLVDGECNSTIFTTKLIALSRDAVRRNSSSRSRVVDALFSENYLPASTIARHRRGTDGLILRSRCAGAQGLVERSRHYWAELLKHKNVELQEADWFFCPEQLWQDVEFWLLLTRNISRIRTMHLHIPSWVKPWNFSTPECQNTDQKSKRRAMRAAVELHLARVSGDGARVAELLAAFPKWGDAKVVQSFIKRYGRGPTRKEVLFSSK